MSATDIQVADLKGRGYLIRIQPICDQDRHACLSPSALKPDLARVRPPRELHEWLPFPAALVSPGGQGTPLG